MSGLLAPAQVVGSSDRKAARCEPTLSHRGLAEVEQASDHFVMRDDDVEMPAARCPDCSLEFEQASAGSGVRYLLCPACGLVRMLPFAALSEALEKPVRQVQVEAI